MGFRLMERRRRLMEAVDEPSRSRPGAVVFWNNCLERDRRAVEVPSRSRRVGGGGATDKTVVEEPSRSRRGVSGSCRGVAVAGRLR